jgi:hypothetical protein
VNHAAMAIRERRMRRWYGDCGEGRGSHRQVKAYTLFAAAQRALVCDCGTEEREAIA